MRIYLNCRSGGHFSERFTERLKHRFNERFNGRFNDFFQRTFFVNVFFLIRALAGIRAASRRGG